MNISDIIINSENTDIFVKLINYYFNNIESFSIINQEENQEENLKIMIDFVNKYENNSIKPDNTLYDFIEENQHNFFLKQSNGQLLTFKSNEIISYEDFIKLKTKFDHVISSGIRGKNQKYLLQILDNFFTSYNSRETYHTCYAQLLFFIRNLDFNTNELFSNFLKLSYIKNIKHTGDGIDEEEKAKQREQIQKQLREEENLKQIKATIEESKEKQLMLSQTGTPFYLSKFIDIFSGYMSYLESGTSLLLKKLTLICTLKDDGIFTMIENEGSNCVKRLKECIKKNSGKIIITNIKAGTLSDDDKKLLEDILNNEKINDKNKMATGSTNIKSYDTLFQVFYSDFSNMDELYERINLFLKKYETFIDHIFDKTNNREKYYLEVKEIVYRTPSIIIKAVDFIADPGDSDDKKKQNKLQEKSNYCNDNIFFYNNSNDIYIKTCIEIKKDCEDIKVNNELIGKKTYGPYKYIALPLPKFESQYNERKEFQIYDYNKDADGNPPEDYKCLKLKYDNKQDYDEAFVERNDNSNFENGQYTTNGPTNKGIFYNYLINANEYGLIQKIINGNIIKFFGYGYSGSGKTYTLLEDSESIFMLSLNCLYKLIGDDYSEMVSKIGDSDPDLIKNFQDKLNIRDDKYLFINIDIFYPYNNIYDTDKTHSLNQTLNKEIRKFEIKTGGSSINIADKNFVKTLLSDTKNSKEFYKQIEDMLLKYGLVIPTSNNPNSSRAFTIVKIVYGEEYLSDQNKTLIEIIDLPGLEKKVDMIYEYVISNDDKDTGEYLIKLNKNKNKNLTEMNDKIESLNKPGEIYKFIKDNINPNNYLDLYLFYIGTADLTNFRVASENSKSGWDRTFMYKRRDQEKKFIFFDRVRFSYNLLLNPKTLEIASDLNTSEIAVPKIDHNFTQATFNTHQNITEKLNDCIKQCINKFALFKNKSEIQDEILITGQLAGTTMIFNENITYNTTTIKSGTIVNAFSFIDHAFYKDKYYVDRIEIAFNNITKFDSKIQNILKNDRNTKKLFNNIYTDNNDKEYENLCTNILSMFYNFNASMLDFDYFSLCFKEGNLFNQHIYNYNSYNYNNHISLGTKSIDHIHTSYFSPFLIIPNSSNASITRSTGNKSMEPFKITGLTVGNYKYDKIEGYNKAKKFYQDVIDKNLGTIIYYMNYKSQLEYDYKYTIHGNKRKKPFTKKSFTNLENFLNETNSTRYEFFEDKDGYMQILNNFYTNFLDDDKYMKNPTDKFKDFDEVNTDCEYLFKEVFKIDTENKTRGGVTFDIGNFETINLNEKDYNFFYFNKHINTNTPGDNITDSFQKIVAKNTKKYKKNVLSTIAYIFNYIDACYFHDYYEYDLNRVKTQDYNVFPPEFYKHLKILFFSMFLNYILDQGSSIVTSLEHLLYEFLIQQPNGIHEYNSHHTTDKKSFDMVAIDNKEKKFSKQFEQPVSDSKIKAYLNLNLNLQDPLVNAVVNTNTLTPNDLTSDLNEDKQYKNTLYAYANSQYTFKAPMSKLEEVVQRKFIVGMRDALNIDNKSRFVNLIAIKRYDTTNDPTYNTNSMTKRCSAIYESLEFANSLISANEMLCNSDNAASIDKINVPKNVEILSGDLIKQKKEQERNLHKQEEINMSKLRVKEHFYNSTVKILKHSVFLSHYFYISKLFKNFYLQYYIFIIEKKPFSEIDDFFNLDIIDFDLATLQSFNCENNKLNGDNDTIKIIISNIIILKCIYALCLKNDDDENYQKYISTIKLIFDKYYSQDNPYFLFNILKIFYFELIFIYLDIFRNLINDYETLDFKDPTFKINIQKINKALDDDNLHLIKLIYRFCYLYKIYYDKIFTGNFQHNILYEYLEEIFKFKEGDNYNFSKGTNKFIIKYNEKVTSDNSEGVFKRINHSDLLISIDSIKLRPKFELYNLISVDVQDFYHINIDDNLKLKTEFSRSNESENVPADGDPDSTALNPYGANTSIWSPYGSSMSTGRKSISDTGNPVNLGVFSSTLGSSKSNFFALGGSKKKRAKNNFTHKKRRLILKNKKQKVKNNNASIKKNNISIIIKNK